VVADPYDVFARGAVRHPLRPFFRWWFSRNLRLHCREAFAAAYVTAHALQRRYPPGAGAHAIHCSDVELPPAAIAERPRQASAANGRPRTLVMVGTLAQLYKAPDVLVDAVARCVQGKLNLRLAFVGDGKHRKELEARAAAEGLNGRVDFLGQLAAGEAVRAVLDRADLFVLPSRQEGLPRALVEAMARGLPCIGSTVGGIPELLAAEDLVPPNDVEALAGKIREVVSDPQRMASTSARNLEMARQYRQEVLDKRRSDFYRYVKNKTAEWLDTNRTPVAGVVPHSARSQPKMRICP
jgi:glycosyltransferase involved in cell wall biosynthesis